MNRSEKWPGGFIRTDSRGRKIYVIRRMGREVSTRATTLRAALRHLERFEADPERYEAVDLSTPLRLDKALVEAFLAWSRDTKKNTRAWVRDQKHYLAWWGDQLAGRDLRRVTLQEIEDALANVTRFKRAEVLKTLYRWLRKRGKIKASEDPTIDGLEAQAPPAEQLTRSRVTTLENYEKARSHLVGTYRHVLTVAGATAWHVTEIQRFAARGRIEPYRGNQENLTAVLVCPWHKVGDPHRTAVGAEAESAARELLKHGSFSRSRLDKAVKEACDLAGVEPFTVAEMRHTIATLAIDGGESLQAVADFLGHRSPRTTKAFYATHATAKKVRTLV